MKKLFIFVAVFTATQNNLASDLKESTKDVASQFHEAFVEIPVNAVKAVAAATKKLATKVADSSEAQNLVDAGKQLIVDAPMQAGESIKAGAQKTYDVVIVKPAKAVSDATTKVVNSEFVQNIKENAQDLGGQFKEAGQDIYVTVIKNPAIAVKKATVTVKDATINAYEKAKKSEAAQNTKELGQQFADVPVQAWENISDMFKAIKEEFVG